MDESSSSSTKPVTPEEWAESLVGRDWEIYWNDDEDKDEKDEESQSGAAPMAVDTTPESQDQDPPTQDEKNDRSDQKSDDDDEGSVIDDWYAGRVISMVVQGTGAISFQVHFVGDEEIYVMELSPGKVRASARGWIKRTMAMLCSSVAKEGELPWYARLLGDTAMGEDKRHLKELLEDQNRSHAYEAIFMPGDVPPEFIPPLDHLNQVLKLRHLLRSQIYLRSKLASIVNLHGSIKYIDGEPNPTEPLVNHLVEYCQGLERACDWYLKCWKLLGACFHQTSGESSQEQKLERQSITYDEIVDLYLDHGKKCLVQCASMDVENPPSSASKRRQSPVTATNPRRRKRRRKPTAKFEDLTLETVVEEDIRSTAVVDQLVIRLNQQNSSWYLPVLTNMMWAISHAMVEPLNHWKLQAHQLLGEKGEDALDVVVPLESSQKMAKERHSKDSGSNESKQCKGCRNEITMEIAKSRVQNDTTPSGASAPASSNVITPAGDTLDTIYKKEDTTSVDESDSDEEDQEKFFTFEQIEACIKALEGNPVFSVLDVSEEEQALTKKLKDIKTLAAEASSWLRRLAEESAAAESDSGTDRVLEGLQQVWRRLNAPEQPLFNIDPIGKAGTALSRDLIQHAVTFRGWILDVRHASRVRERKSFLESLHVRMDSLPSMDLPAFLESDQLVVARSNAEAMTRQLYDKICQMAAVESKYRTILDQEHPGPLTKDGTQKALEELAKYSSILLVEEEELALRLDMLEWVEGVRSMFSVESSKTRIGFAQLENIHESLQLVLQGKSPSRDKIARCAKANERVENQVRHFIAYDAKRLSEENIQQMQQVLSLYGVSSQWKERAEVVISALRTYGNPATGEVRPNSLKLPSMVDIKRISDLISEYTALGVDVPGYTDILQRVQDDALQWWARLDAFMSHEIHSFQDCLTFLQRESECRPKGLIMDPTRQVLDSVVELLDWHHRTKQSLKGLQAALRIASQESSQLSDNAYAGHLIKSVYPLLGEGVAVVEVFARNNRRSFPSNIETCAKHLEAYFGVKRSARALDREKVESHPLGAGLLQRMTKSESDSVEGFPLSMLLWVEWYLSVTAYVSSNQKTSEDESDSQKRPFRQAFSLAQAQELNALQPLPLPNGSIPMSVNFLWNFQTKEVGKLNRLIAQAEQSEGEIRGLLSKFRELRKGSLQKADAVRNHLNRLKELLLVLKNRAVGESGLSLNPTLEPQVEQHIKIFAWLVRTFSYSFLYLDEASYSSPEDAKSEETSRVPWDVLVTLYERLPLEEGEARADDFALVSLRVRELYGAAKNWQDEITRTTLLSNRGRKRRAPSGLPAKSEADAESSTKLQIEKMKQLAENPILSKVAMPREGAVNGILQSSTEFETHFHEFLRKDFEGENPDRAAYPDSESLVGKDGEFILFRLTGSELFDTMLESINELFLVAENVLAETPGKATFDWIRKAVGWMEQLNESVTKESPFQNARKNILIVPAGDARRLLIEGEQIFLVMSEDLKRTLSEHGIFVTTNKQERSLRVALKKDGAHHSVGGTVIRWCPILFESLRADIERLSEWEKELTTILSQFNKFFAETRNNPKTEERDLYRWYCFQERVGLLLREGARSLVVSPQQGLVSSFSTLLASLQKYLSKHSKPELDIKFARKWFAEGTSLLDDRYGYLEALLYRKYTSKDQKPTKTLPDDGERSFRDICRNYLVTSFSKAVKTIGMMRMKALVKMRDLEGYCCIKAWEIENEMYDRFQQGLGVARVSDEYKNKARSLRVSLDDKHNLSLCLRVLIGDISAVSLVGMTREQLASQKAKLDRARAEEEARSSSNLTPQLPAECSKETEMEDTTEKPTPKIDGTTSGPTSILRSSYSQQKPSNQSSPPSASKAPNTKAEQGKAATPEPPPLFQNLLSTEVADLSAAALQKLASKSTLKARPPPPPSLVNTFQQQSGEVDGLSDRGQRVINVSGGDKFRIEIVNLRISFSAAFYLEDESQEGVHRFLPENLSEKGRLPDKEFSRFVSDKVAHGRWEAIPLRMATLSDQDSSQYKRFYQAYEAKKRIAMFAVNQNTKLFLVTPKFHGAAKATGVVSLANKISTYAIVLTKDTRMLMD